MKKLVLIGMAVVLLISFVGCSQPISSGELSWLSELEADDVKEISVENGYEGVSPDIKPDISATADRDEIERMVNAWKNVKLTWEPYIPSTGGTPYIKVSFILQSGEAYTISLIDGYYTEGGKYFVLSEIPLIDTDK